LDLIDRHEHRKKVETDWESHWQAGQKRVVEFDEWLCEQVLKHVPHRQWVFSIAKRLRIYFLFDRKLLTKLNNAQC